MLGYPGSKPRILWNVYFPKSIIVCQPLASFSILALSAFTRETLLDKRWLLGGTSRASCGLWHEILTIDDVKQRLFMKRLLHLHTVHCRRAGRACLMRMSSDQWLAEIERICLLGYIFNDMMKNEAFDVETLQKVQIGILEGHPGLICHHHIIVFFSLKDVG